MSLLSAVKKVVAKVNEHIEDFKGVQVDIDELYDRVIALEGGEKEEEPTPGAPESSSEEEGLKLEE